MSEVDTRQYSSETVVANERIKGISGALTNLGLALVAATAARVYVASRFDLVSFSWAIGCVVLIWIAWLVLGQMEKDN